MSKTRILFEGHDLKFLTHVMDHYKVNHRYHVDVFTYEGHIIRDHREIIRILPEIDIIFSEWGLGNLQWFSHHKLPGQKLVVRIHSQEFSTHYLSETKWENVDKIIVVGPYMKVKFDQLFPGASQKSEVIYNLVDTESFNLEKVPEARFNLGILGILPMHKSPHRALEILMELRKTDKRYRLFVKGKRPDEVAWLWKKPEEQAYYTSFYETIEKEGLQDLVIFDPQGNDVPEWFRNIGFIISPGNHESFHLAVAEGMASGTVPVIRNWIGSDLLYPGKYIYDSKEQAASLILKFSENDSFIKEGVELQHFCRENFDVRNILPKYDKILLPEFHPAEIRKEYFDLLRERDQYVNEIESIKKQKVKAENDLFELIRQQDKFSVSNSVLTQEIKAFGTELQNQHQILRDQVDIVVQKVQTKESLQLINQKQLDIIQTLEQTIHQQESSLGQQQAVIEKITAKSEASENKITELTGRLEETVRERDSFILESRHLTENLNIANQKLKDQEQSAGKIIEALNEEKKSIRSHHEAESARIRKEYEGILEITRNNALNENTQLRERFEKENALLKELMNGQITRLESQILLLKSETQATIQRMEQDRALMQSKLDKQLEINHELEMKLFRTFASLTWKVGSIFIKKPGDFFRNIRKKLSPSK